MKFFLKGEWGRTDLDVRPPLYLSILLFAAVVAGLLLAVLPSAYCILWSLLGTETLGILADRPTWHWFSRVVNDSEWLAAIAYSLVLAATASAAGCCLLLIHFYFVRYSRPRFDRIAYVFVVLVALIPTVVYALALRWTYGILGLWEWLPLLLGQFVMLLPVQFFVFESAQEVAPDELVFAGSVLGASHPQNIVTVYVPAVRHAALAAFLIGFFVAFDELVLATFMIDSVRVTVPRRLWDQINSKMDPTPAVVSSLLGLAFVVTILIPVVWGRFRALTKRSAAD